MKRDSTALKLRSEFLDGGWPSGAPVEFWAEKATHLAVRQLSRLVLALEDRIASLERDNEHAYHAYRELTEGRP